MGGGLVFAVHPVNVATVAWISEQKNTLSMFFYAVAILLYLRFDETTRWRWYGLSLAAFLLALLSKTAAVMLPVALLGCVWWRHRGLRVRDILYSVPFFGLSLVLGLATVWYQRHQVLRGGTVQLGGFASRLAMAGRAPWFYLSRALLPVDLTVIYPKWEIDPSRWISYAPGMILIGCLLVLWWKRRVWGRPLLFGLGYFLVTLFPVLGFFDQAFYSSTLVADHWQYFSIVGVIALVVGAGASMCRRLGERGRNWGMAVSVVVLLALGTATWRRSLVYANEETLWRDNLAKNPNAWMAHSNLGVELEESGKLSEAEEHYEESLRINPQPETHCSLGNVFLQEGRLEEAIGEYQQALRIKPDYAMAYYNLGVILERTGRAQDAIVQYEQALRINPNHAETHSSLGNVLLQEGRLDEAIGEYQQALRIKPDYAPAHNNLGKALLASGKVSEAMGHFELALRLEPDSATAHSNLGGILQRLGKLPEAVAQYEQALRIKPDYADAHYNLGVALEQAGRVQEAISHYEQALRIKPDFVQARNALARARAVQ